MTTDAAYRLHAETMTQGINAILALHDQCPDHEQPQHVIDDWWRQWRKTLHRVESALRQTGEDGIEIFVADLARLEPDGPDDEDGWWLLDMRVWQLRDAALEWTLCDFDAELVFDPPPQHIILRS